MVSTPRNVDLDLRASGAADNAALAEDYRRLADMILAAFNHAYAAGTPDVADRLWTLLADVEGRYAAAEMGRKPGMNAVHQAELWVEFIEARNRYREALDSPEASTRLEKAFLDMKAAYRRWSET